MIAVKWTTYDDTEIDFFSVYRSIPGFVIPFPNALVAGNEFIFSATSPDIQKLVLTASDIDSFVTLVNTKGRGVEARKSYDETKVYIRATAQKNPRIKTFKCSALQSLGITPTIYAPAVTWEKVAEVLWEEGETSYQFDDEDGSYLDVYYVTSSIGVVESIPSIIMPVLPNNPSLCALEARFVDPQGKPVQNVMVRATLYVPERGGISISPVVQRSDVYGRVNLPLLQSQQYLLEIPAVGYNWVIDVPQEASANILSLPATVVQLFSPFGDPS